VAYAIPHSADRKSSATGTSFRSRLGTILHAPISLWGRLPRGVRWTLLGLVIFLVLARLALPFIVKGYVNRQLARIPDYHGNVRNIDIHLLRGAYIIHDIAVVKTSGRVPVPFFKAARMDLSVEWKELFHGSVVGEVYMDYPELNFVAGPTQADSQTGEDKAWRKTLESLFPFRLNRLVVTAGKIHFRNFHSRPPVDIYIHGLNAIATNLTNSRDVKEKLPAGMIAQGQTLGDGQLQMTLHLTNWRRPLPT
jgi:hypothetical protein